MKNQNFSFLLPAQYRPDPFVQRLLVLPRELREELEQGVRVHLRRVDERELVKVGEQRHQRQTVDAVGHASVPRDRVAEVLDIVRALESAREEAAERADHRYQQRDEERVDLKARDRHGELHQSRLFKNFSFLHI